MAPDETRITTWPFRRSAAIWRASPLRWTSDGAAVPPVTVLVPSLTTIRSGEVGDMT
jgi:hypothetical protein